MGLVPNSERGLFTAKKEIVSLTSGMIISFLMGALIDFFEEKGENIWIAKSAKVAPTASITGPCIIDEDAEIHRYAKEHGVYDNLKEIMGLRAYGSHKWNYNRLSSYSLKRKFARRWSKDVRQMLKDGEITRRFFSKSRIVRLWFLAYFPWVYSFTRKF